MKKKVLGLLMAAVLCLGLLPIGALAAETPATAYPDAFDADGEVTKGNERNGIAYTGNTSGDETLDGTKFYIVQEDAIINGNLTINGTGGGLIICEGKTLTVKGALIFNGDSFFGIYGQSYDNGTAVGELAINNSKGNGAAIRTDSSTTPQLRICSGELTINGGENGKLVKGVELYSESHVHMGKLNDNEVLPAEWSGVSSIGGTSLVLEYCAHEGAEYTPDADGKHHTKTCTQCGFNIGMGGLTKKAKCTFEERLYHIDEDKHYNACLCGNYNEQGGVHHNAEKTVLTDGNRKHAVGCSVCEYASEKASDHSYNENGVCTVCTFAPFAKDENGDLYGTTEDNTNISGEINDVLAEGGTIKLWRPDEVEDKTIQGIHIEFDAADKSATLDMNGYTLEYSGGVPLTVSNGTLTVTGAATIKNTGESQ